MADTTFYIKQHKEMFEAVVGWEKENRYSVIDGRQRTLATAIESSSWVTRMFLKGLRPFEMAVSGPNGEPLMFLKREFAFILHRLEVRDENNRPLGAIQRNFTFFNREYVIEDAARRPLLQISGPIWWPWTFNILQNGLQKGTISKKWSGFLRESFTDADNFSVTCPEQWDGNLRKLLIAATLLIDFIHFEN